MSGNETVSGDLREGTSEQTVKTPDDFPDEYDYGSGRINDWSREYMLKKTPKPQGNQTVLNTGVNPEEIQVLYLWEEGNVPAVTEFTEDMDGYFDAWDFRPYVTAIPVREGVEPKGAVVLMAGGAYQFRGNYTDSLTTAAALRESGFQAFVVDYRLHPYTQEEGALDVARAVRFIRKNADAYGIRPDDIAVMGFSAGGIQAGEFFMHYDEEVNGTALDPSYVPDELDEIPAHASACGMIYSFYGKLSVGNMDPNWLAKGNLPPTFYVYGTEDLFYRQFEQQYDVVRGMGIPAERIVLNGWPHGFGSEEHSTKEFVFGDVITEGIHSSGYNKVTKNKKEDLICLLSISIKTIYQAAGARPRERFLEWCKGGADMGLFDFFKQPDINQGVKEYKAAPDAVLVDVRTVQEYREGHIPESKNVPLQQLDKIASVAKNKDIQLFVYCYSGSRSRQAASILRQMGYTNVNNIGGIAAYSGKVE